VVFYWVRILSFVKVVRRRAEEEKINCFLLGSDFERNYDYSHSCTASPCGGGLEYIHRNPCEP
jgi:hypothetical protein